MVRNPFLWMSQKKDLLNSLGMIQKLIHLTWWIDPAFVPYEIHDISVKLNQLALKEYWIITHKICKLDEIELEKHNKKKV